MTTTIKYIIRKRSNSSIKKKTKGGISNNNKKLIIKLFSSFKTLLDIEPTSIKPFIIMPTLRSKKLSAIDLT
jgi:hypothetical protein